MPINQYWLTYEVNHTIIKETYNSSVGGYNDQKVFERFERWCKEAKESWLRDQKYPKDHVAVVLQHVRGCDEADYEVVQIFQPSSHFKSWSKHELIAKCP